MLSRSAYDFHLRVYSPQIPKLKDFPVVPVGFNISGEAFTKYTVFIKNEFTGYDRSLFNAHFNYMIIDKMNLKLTIQLEDSVQLTLFAR